MVYCTVVLPSTGVVFLADKMLTTRTLEYVFKALSLLIVSMAALTAKATSMEWVSTRIGTGGAVLGCVEPDIQWMLPTASCIRWASWWWSWAWASSGVGYVFITGNTVGRLWMYLSSIGSEVVGVGVGVAGEGCCLVVPRRGAAEV